MLMKKYDVKSPEVHRHGPSTSRITRASVTKEISSSMASQPTGGMGPRYINVKRKRTRETKARACACTFCRAKMNSASAPPRLQGVGRTTSHLCPSPNILLLSPTDHVNHRFFRLVFSSYPIIPPHCNRCSPRHRAQSDAVAGCMHVSLRNSSIQYSISTLYSTVTMPLRRVSTWCRRAVAAAGDRMPSHRAFSSHFS